MQEWKDHLNTTQNSSENESNTLHQMHAQKYSQIQNQKHVNNKENQETQNMSDKVITPLNNKNNICRDIFASETNHWYFFSAQHRAKEILLKP